MDIKDLTILICDDSILIRKKLLDSLVSLGCNADMIWAAADGEEAISQYQEHSPYLVFMDIVMPKKSGIDAVREIKAINENAKIIMVSSVGTNANLREAIIAGASDFIQKPLDPTQVEHILRTIVKEVN